MDIEMEINIKILVKQRNCFFICIIRPQISTGYVPLTSVNRMGPFCLMQMVDTKAQSQQEKVTKSTGNHSHSHDKTITNGSWGETIKQTNIKRYQYEDLS